MKITTRALIFNEEQKLLTVQHHGSDFWSLPGGKIDEGEDLKTCLKREIFEELGVQCEILNLAFVHEFRWSPESDVTTEFFFVVKISEKNMDISQFSGKFAEQELKKISWNTLDETLNVKPEFLKNQKLLKMKNTVEYFSYI